MRLLIAIVLLLGGGQAGFRGYAQPSAQTRHAAFVAYKTHTAFPIDANSASTSSQVIFARRSDGSWAEIFHVLSPDGEGGREMSILNLTSRTSVIVEPFTKSIATFHFSAQNASIFVQAPGYRCDGSEQGVQQRATLHRLEVIALTTKREGVISQKWVAPALDCYPLEQSITFQKGDRTVHKVTRLELGEPGAEMFSPPNGFVERSPSEIQQAYVARYHGRPRWSDNMLARLSKRYQIGRGQ